MNDVLLAWFRLLNPWLALFEARPVDAAPFAERSPSRHNNVLTISVLPVYNDCVNRERKAN